MLGGGGYGTNRARPSSAPRERPNGMATAGVRTAAGGGGGGGGDRALSARVSSCAAEENSWGIVTLWL